MEGGWTKLSESRRSLKCYISGAMASLCLSLCKLGPSTSAADQSVFLRLRAIYILHHSNDSDQEDLPSSRAEHSPPTVVYIEPRLGKMGGLDYPFAKRTRRKTNLGAVQVDATFSHGCTRSSITAVSCLR